MPPALLRTRSRLISSGAVAEGALRLGDHLPRAAETVEVVDVERAEEHSQRVEGVGQQYVVRHALRAVHVHVKLRGVRAEDVRLHGHIGSAGDAWVFLLPRLVDEEIRLLLESRKAEVAAVLDHRAESSRAAGAAYRHGGKDAHAGAGNLGGEPLRQRGGDLLAIQPRLLAVLEIVEDDEHRAEVRGVDLEGERHPRHRQGVPHPGSAVANLLHVVGDRPRPLRRGGVRRLQADHQVAHVLRRDEALRGDLEFPIGQGEQAGIDDQRRGDDADQAADAADIGARRRLKAGVESVERPTQDGDRRAGDQPAGQRRDGNGRRRRDPAQGDQRVLRRGLGKQQREPAKPYRQDRRQPHVARPTRRRRGKKAAATARASPCPAPSERRPQAPG